VSRITPSVLIVADIGMVDPAMLTEETGGSETSSSSSNEYYQGGTIAVYAAGPPYKCHNKNSLKQMATERTLLGREPHGFRLFRVKCMAIKGDMQRYITKFMKSSF